MNPLRLLRKKSSSDAQPYEWPKPVWKCLLFFPLDLVYFHLDLVRNVWTFLRWICFTKPKCFYCDTAANAGLTIKRNDPARRYTNFWMARILCPCTQAPRPDHCPVPFCEAKKRKQLQVIPVGLVTLLIWVGLGTAAASYPPARQLVRKVLPKQTTQQLKRLVPMKNPLERARKMVDEKNYMEARIAYMNAVQQNPSNALVRAEFADVLLEMKLWGQALRELKAATQLNPTNQSAVTQFVTLSTLARKAESALPAARKMEAALPDEVQPKLVLASALAANKELDEAADVLSRVKDHPELSSTEAFQAGSLAINLLRNRPLAQHFYQHTVKQDPEHLTAHIQLSKLDRLSGNVAQAKVSLDLAAQLDPGHFEVIAEQAEHLMREGKLDQALANMRQAQERNASWGYLKARYAEMLLMAGRFDEAKQIAEKLREERAPREEAMGHTVLAQIYLEKQLYPDAVASAEAAIELDGTHYRQHTMLARAQMARKNFEAAQTALDAAIALEPGLLELRMTEAQMAYAQNQFTNGLARLEAIAARPEIDPATTLQMASLAYQHGQYIPAGQWFAQVHEAYPDQAIAAIGLVRCNLQLGEDPSGTLEIARGLAQRFPESVDFVLTYLEVLVGSENPAAQLPEIERLAAQFAFNPTSHYLLGKAYLLSQRPAEARKALEETLKMSPRYHKVREIQGILDSLP